MKKTVIMLAMGISAAAFAGENLIANGGFETIKKTPKASSKYLMGQIKQGWDFGPGPVAKVPVNWSPNGGKIKSAVIEVGENGENKENVAEGKISMHFSGNGFHMYSASSLKPGKYTFSFKYKGSGRVTICFYCYGKDPATGKQKHIRSIAPMTVMAKPEWQTFTKTMEIGGADWAPGIDRCTFALTGTKCDVYVDDIVVTEAKEEAAK